MLAFFPSELVRSAALITRHAKSGDSGARNAMLSCLPEWQQLTSY